MYPIRFVLLNQLLLLGIFSSETVKIGISKPLPISTTTISSTTAVDTTTDETSTDLVVSTTTSSLTSAKPITDETEWTEFPPKKTWKIFNKSTSKGAPTSTMKPLITTMTSSEMDNETKIPNESETPKAFSPLWRTKQNYCFCDLTQDTCDISCCCDRDCSAEALKVFRCRIGLEPQEERFDDFNFQHGLPSCEVNDGWLCVFRIYKPAIKKEGFYDLKDTSHYYKWPNLLLESEDVKNREYYKFGDSLRIINTETKEIQNFDLPSSFESSFCNIQQPIYHLKSIQRSCLFTSYENLKEFQFRLLQLEEKYKIFNTPLIPDVIYHNKDFENFVGNFTINKCFENKRNCSRYKYGRESDEDFTLFKVKVNILHNFTNVQEVIVDLWFQNWKKEEYREDTEQEYWLSYEIEFFNKTLKEFNATKNIATQRPPIIAGPLGYLVGRPIIISRYEPFNKSQPLSVNNQVLSYFSLNNSETHTLTMLAKENGECKRSLEDREPISYGINVANYCKIKLENDSFIEEQPANINFTEICLNLQQRVHNQLFGQELIVEDLASYFVSQLGKPQNISNKWLQLQVYNTDFDPVFGQYLHETNTFVCRNILLGLAYEFHMSTSMVDNIPLQKVIKQAALHLDERHDLEFSLNEKLEVPITMTVRFFNIRERLASAGFTLKKIHFIIYLILELATTLIYL